MKFYFFFFVLDLILISLEEIVMKSLVLIQEIVELVEIFLELDMVFSENIFLSEVIMK